MTHDLWAALNEHIFSFLSGVTLAQLVTQQQPSDVAVLQDHRASAGRSRRPSCPSPRPDGSPIVHRLP